MVSGTGLSAPRKNEMRGAVFLRSLGLTGSEFTLQMCFDGIPFSADMSVTMAYLVVTVSVMLMLPGWTWRLTGSTRCGISILLGSLIFNPSQRVLSSEMSDLQHAL